MPCGKKHILMIIKKTGYFILIERSEVKLRLFSKIRYAEEKLRKSRLKLKFRLRKKYSVFLRTVAVKKRFPNYSPFTVHVVLEW